MRCWLCSPAAAAVVVEGAEWPANPNPFMCAELGVVAEAEAAAADNPGIAPAAPGDCPGSGDARAEAAFRFPCAPAPPLRSGRACACAAAEEPMRRPVRVGPAPPDAPAAAAAADPPIAEARAGMWQLAARALPPAMPPAADAAALLTASADGGSGGSPGIAANAPAPLMLPLPVKAAAAARAKPSIEAVCTAPVKCGDAAGADGDGAGVGDADRRRALRPTPMVDGASSPLPLPSLTARRTNLLAGAASAAAVAPAAAADTAEAAETAQCVAGGAEPVRARASRKAAEPGAAAASSEGAEFTAPPPAPATRDCRPMATPAAASPCASTSVTGRSAAPTEENAIAAG